MGWTVFVTEAGTSIYSSNLSPATLATTCRRLPLTTNTARKKLTMPSYLRLLFIEKSLHVYYHYFPRPPTAPRQPTTTAYAVNWAVGNGQLGIAPSHPH